MKGRLMQAGGKLRGMVEGWWVRERSRGLLSCVAIAFVLSARGDLRQIASSGTTRGELTIAMFTHAAAGLFYLTLASVFFGLIRAIGKDLPRRNLALLTAWLFAACSGAQFVRMLGEGYRLPWMILATRIFLLPTLLTLSVGSADSGERGVSAKAISICISGRTA
jgi:hypothetical protein